MFGTINGHKLGQHESEIKKINPHKSQQQLLLILIILLLILFNVQYLTYLILDFISCSELSNLNIFMLSTFLILILIHVQYLSESAGWGT